MGTICGPETLVSDNLSTRDNPEDGKILSLGVFHDVTSSDICSSADKNHC